jgi:hypothetical protein
MADPVTDATPSQAFLRVLNPILRTAVRSPLGRWIGPFAVLSFDGRRTGRRYDVVVTWHELDGRPVLVTPSPWRANFAGAGAPLTLLHRGSELHGTGTLVTDPTAVAGAVARLQESGQPLQAFGLKGPRGHLLTPEDARRTDRAVVTVEPR